MLEILFCYIIFVDHFVDVVQAIKFLNLGIFFMMSVQNEI
jgi:hypothetical protein